MIERGTNPTCGEVECFACDDGHCIILTKKNFKKACPFFKTKEQVKNEKEYCRQRMAGLRKGE